MRIKEVVSDAEKRSVELKKQAAKTGHFVPSFPVERGEFPH